MKSALASKEIFTRRDRGGALDVVLAQVPSHAHWAVVGAATIFGSYCPTCSPSPEGEGPSENAYAKTKHEKDCARTRPDL